MQVSHRNTRMEEQLNRHHGATARSFSEDAQILLTGPSELGPEMLLDTFDLGIIPSAASAEARPEHGLQPRRWTDRIRKPVRSLQVNPRLRSYVNKLRGGGVRTLEVAHDTVRNQRSYDRRMAALITSVYHHTNIRTKSRPKPLSQEHISSYCDFMILGMNNLTRLPRFGQCEHVRNFANLFTYIVSTTVVRFKSHVERTCAEVLDVHTTELRIDGGGIPSISNGLNAQRSKHGDQRSNRVSVNDWVADAQKTVVIMDTSTGYIHGPERTVAEINSMIDPVESTGTFTFVNCDTWLALPTISFSGSFEELKFTPNDYVIKTTDGKCMSVFVSSKSDERFWRFGIAAHRHRYVIYNEFRKLVEFAAAKCP
ncbi:pregnancy-associated glycoprotein 6-like [Clonorchis sinensis]|uniref:Pregnancy-associated glycoprotein 6-like n=1 Tax=Clonorchis sinensis TaxID=79923 RepID=G7Y490_CLOSI|nr:pregnancy-associated glycoprotein 6-like [Clonorchis sinensis]